MIEQQTIDGRKATVAYLNADFTPADKDTFQFAKILFDDGEMIFLAAPPDGTFHVDILQHELDGKLPHWLSPEAKMAGKRDAIRAKHRAAHLAKARKPARSETLAKLTAAYESAKAKDPAADPDTIAESLAFGRHRQRTYLPPVADIEGAAESAAWAKHRMRHLIVIDTDFGAIAIQEPTEPDDIPVKLQLVAWAKAIIVLDQSEILARDLIERELAGAHVMPIARAIRTTDRLVHKIRGIRETAIKLAFRLLRDRLGDSAILGHSLATWAQTFAQNDLAAIKTAIQSGLADGLDSTEIARKVVGTMALNGVDGVTEYTRHKIAHLGRASIRQSREAQT